MSKQPDSLPKALKDKQTKDIAKIDVTLAMQDQVDFCTKRFLS